jgi:hypothetical protein
MAVPWIRQLVANLPTQRRGLTPVPGHVGFVVDKVALGRVFLRVIQFYCQYHSTVALHIHISSGG